MYRSSRTFLLLLVAASGFLFSAMSQAQITVNVSPVETGTVNIAGVMEIDYREDCRDLCVTYSAPDDQNGSATFTASPDSGYQFAGWTKDGSPQGSNTVFVLASDQGIFPETTLTASFEKLAADSDGDGIEDGQDQCANTPSGESVNSSGCSASQIDSDGDNVYDDVDQCANTPSGEYVDSAGCSASQIDSDGDNVYDDVDQCANTPSGESVNSSGCSASQIDSDGDNVYDDVDQCANTPYGESVDSSGCSASQIDSDGDNVYDDVDQCANTPSGQPVDSFGCSQGQLDGDGDGIYNDADQCPNTPAGESVNSSGCSDSQVDGDGDGVSNDADQCPNTPSGESVDSAGCSASQIDSDNDGVYNNADQCPNTPSGEAVDSAGCSVAGDDNAAPADTDWDGVPDTDDLCPYTIPQPGLSIDATGCAENEIDTDDDGVVDQRDECPDTNSGDIVNKKGCSDAQIDDDADGVGNFADQCPSTLAGELVDINGCSASQKDTDSDGVDDQADACPATPVGDSVDAEGCSASQKDTDSDGVDDQADLCPATPAGDSVDAEGCSASQKDTDFDGVSDKLDLCPATPAGESVDLAGCADSQRDEDGDGVSDLLDECPVTPPGESTDSIGCSEGQRDDDGDGVSNSRDICAATDTGKLADETGCSVVQNELADLGDDLVELEDLSEDDQTLAGAIDDACPRLIIEGDQQALTAGQQDLLAACSSLKSNDSSSDQQIAALQAISPQLLANRIDAVIETASRHHQQLTQRLGRIKSGGGRGVSLAGLSLNFAGQALPGALLEEAADQAGMGDLGPDFGNWGIYLQGDLDVTERRDTDSRRQYDEDAWLVTVGADYRFSPQLYAGLALSLGETETEYADARSDSETTALTLYGGWQFSDAGFLDVQLGWADDDYDMSREVTYVDAGGSFSSDYRGAAGGDHMTAAVNLGYMLNTAGWRLGPTASYFYLDGEVDAYKETASEGSSKAWEMAVAGSRFEKSILRLGLQADYAWLTDFGVLIPGVMLHFVSESNRGDTVTSTLLANDLEGFGQEMGIRREVLDGQYWDASFNLAGQFSYGFSGFASYRITAARDGYQHRGYTLGLRWDQAF